jgi:hypothetical protein
MSFQFCILFIFLHAEYTQHQDVNALRKCLAPSSIANSRFSTVIPNCSLFGVYSDWYHNTKYNSNIHKPIHAIRSKRSTIVALRNDQQYRVRSRPAQNILCRTVNTEVAGFFRQAEHLVITGLWAEHREGWTFCAVIRNTKNKSWM